MDRQPPVPLDDETARFLACGESITVGSRDVRCVPSLIKAAGCRVDPTARRVRVLVDRRQARQLLADVAATGAVALVVSRPSTHHTLQVKGSDAAVEPLRDGDAEVAVAHRLAFARELVPLGYRRDWTRAIHEFPVEELVAVAFTVDAAYAQTPGPGAGARLELPR